MSYILHPHFENQIHAVNECRGDFRRSNYWLALTHKFISPLSFNFFQGKGAKVRINPQFLRDLWFGG